MGLGTQGAVVPQRWLFGPGRDLLLGCGLGYALLFFALGFYGPPFRTGTSPLLLPFIALLVSAPHYGATLLRVYERREDRRAYRLFAVWATLLLLACFGVATRSIWMGSLLVTLYATWSPWHYTGQNYGLAVLFLRRRGVPVEPVLKRLIHASFVLSFFITFVVLHRGDLAGGYAPLLYDAESYRVIPLGIPPRVADVLVSVGGVAYLGSLAAAAVLLLRRASPSDLLPSAALVLTQALWFAIPVLARQWGLVSGFEPLAPEYATYYFLWAALGHAVQYVWVTTYFARKSPGFRGLTPYLGKILLAGIAAWVLPAFLFAPDLLGRIPFDAGLGALVAAAVNIHHFILDGAIWKLRDGRIARVLIRSEARQPVEPFGAPARRGWLGPPALALGTACLGLALFSHFEAEYGLRRAAERRDLTRMLVAAERLDWMGRESARLHLSLARELTLRDPSAALRQYQRSLEVQPAPEAWVETAELLAGAGQFGAAEAAFQQALGLAGQHAVVHYRAGLLQLERGDPARALPLLERAVEIDPENKLYRLSLDKARRRAATAHAAPVPSPAAGSERRPSG